MAVKPNRIRYLRSLSEELASQETRVRDLIGDRHWLTDGHHKEYLFTSLLSRYLPVGTVASRGFVIDPFDHALRSTEQDILVVDLLREAPVFHQSGLVIAFPRQVLASISIKTTAGRTEIHDAIKGLSTVAPMPLRDVADQRTWYGAYFFQPSQNPPMNPQTILQQIQSGCMASQSSYSAPDNDYARLDCVACFGDLFFSTSTNTPSVGIYHTHVRGYSCPGIATALFIGQLLDHVATRRGATETDFLTSMDEIECRPIAANGLPLFQKS